MAAAPAEPLVFVTGHARRAAVAQPAIGRAAYMLFASAAFALALAPGADRDDLAATVGEWTAVALFAVSFAHFSLVFPAPREALHLRGLRPLALAPPVLGVPGGLAAWSRPGWYAMASLARMAVLLTYLSIGVASLVHEWATARDHDAHRGLAVIGGGTAVSVAPLAALYLLPTVLGRPVLLPAEQAILALGLLPASVAYAILRHRALDITLLQRWLVHGLLWASLLALYAAAVYALHAQLVAALPTLGRSLALAVVLVLLVGVSFHWLHDALRRAIDRLIFRDAYDYRAALQRLSRDLSLAGHVALRAWGSPASSVG